MANINQIEDEKGDVIEIEYFCSDYCAKTSKNYKGWFGCVEIEDHNNTNCSNSLCNNLIGKEV